MSIDCSPIRGRLVKAQGPVLGFHHRLRARVVVLQQLPLDESLEQPQGMKHQRNKSKLRNLLILCCPLVVVAVVCRRQHD